MTTPAQPPSISVGRLTGFVLGTVVFVCVALIGLAGYLNHQLGNAERLLAAPEAAVTADQENLDKLRRSLGYSGFVGYAQNFIASRDASIVSDMKAQLKIAHDVISRLPEKTPAPIQRDLQSIVETYDTAMKKAEKSLNDPIVTFTAADLAPLYATLPVMDSRITNTAAGARLTAQNEAQFWAMLLTLISWISLIIASAMAVGIYLALRDRNSAPMRALAQSIKNMSGGDMRTPIWGMERSDMIGELARTVDLARYHFSQLPDMSILSEQGPVRIRFEGNTRSLFEAMMNLITKDSEELRNRTIGLTTALNHQQESITAITQQVESVLHNILQRGQDGTKQVEHVLRDSLVSAEALKHAQERAANQLSRIIPFMQERAQGLTEITQITGKQVAQALQSITISEHALKNSADKSEEAIQKLSSSADELGSRLFGAVNLLQASGKVLSETTETTQSRLNEAIEQLNKTIKQPTFAAEYVGRVEKLIGALEAAQKTMEERVSEQTQAAKAQIDLLSTHSTSLLAQSTTTAETLSSATNHLRDEKQKLDDSITHITSRLDDISNRMEAQAHAAFGKTETAVGQNQNQLAELVVQVSQMASKLNSLSSITESAAREPAFASNMLLEIKSGFETTVRSLGQMRDQLTNMVINVGSHAPPTVVTGASNDQVKEIGEKVEANRSALASLITERIGKLETRISALDTATSGSGASRETEMQDLAAKIETTRTTLSELITQQIQKLESRITTISEQKPEPAEPPISRETQEQMEQQTQILTELVATLGVLDVHMQQIKTEMRGTKKA